MNVRHSLTSKKCGDGHDQVEEEGPSSSKMSIEPALARIPPAFAWTIKKVEFFMVLPHLQNLLGRRNKNVSKDNYYFQNLDHRRKNPSSSSKFGTGGTDLLPLLLLEPAEVDLLDGDGTRRQEGMSMCHPAKPQSKKLQDVETQEEEIPRRREKFPRHEDEEEIEISWIWTSTRLHDDKGEEEEPLNKSPKPSLMEELDPKIEFRLMKIFTFINYYPHMMLKALRFVEEQSQSQSHEFYYYPMFPLLSTFLESFKRFEKTISSTLLKTVDEDELLEDDLLIWNERDAILNQRIQDCEESLKKIGIKWKRLLNQQSMQIEGLRRRIEEARKVGEGKMLKEAVRKHTELLLSSKLHERKVSTLLASLDLRESDLASSVSLLMNGFHSLRTLREDKSWDVQEARRKYEEEISLQLKILEEIKVLEGERDEEIQRLQRVRDGVKERYEEMKNTKRLKELLSNLHMAETVRENWAARRIQMCWKRYRARKMMRSKKRLKKGRKKDKGGAVGEDKTSSSSKIRRQATSSVMTVKKKKP